jgi:hypothetical protein
VRLGLVVLALALASCGTDDTTPSEPQGCLRLDGSYSLTYAEPACGRSGAITDRLVVINQSGCSVNAILPGYALLDGTVTGDTLLFSLTLLASSGTCGNAHVSGTARVTSSGGMLTIVGTYGTSAPPPAGCACLASPGQGTLTLAM